MVQGMFQPNINRPSGHGNVNHQAEQLAKANEHVSELKESIGALKSELADLKEEIGGRVRIRDKDSGVSRKDADDHRSQSSQNHSTDSIESNKQQFQKQASMNTHDHGEKSNATAASQAAGLLADDELERLKKKSNSKGSLLDKLGLLSKLEGDFSGFKFKDPEKQKVVDEFFDNLSRIKHLKNRMSQLEHIEREHEAKKRKES